MKPPSGGATGSAPPSTSVSMAISADVTGPVSSSPHRHRPVGDALARSLGHRRCRSGLDSLLRADTARQQTHSGHAGRAAAPRFVQQRVA